jgi:hypothetical protein
MQHGAPVEPFMGKTLPPLDAFVGKRDNVIRQSRERYGRERQVVEAKIGRWLRVKHGY